MIISVEKAKELMDFGDWPDRKIEAKLTAVEQTIRAYTNNNFQIRTIRATCSADSTGIHGTVPGLKVGDTVELSESLYNAGLYVVDFIGNGIFTVGDDVELTPEPHVLVTKISYPADVVDCALNLLRWEMTSREKVGIQSETISRHSVTYFNMDGANSVMGYPVSLLGALKPYRKVRC